MCCSVFRRRRHGLGDGEPGIVVRPLEPIASYPNESVVLSTESLRAWAGSDAFATAEKYFGEYPPQSLLGPISRLILYHAIRSTRPDLVVEIGTYMAGTAEVIARALWENRAGTLATADPFGGERCPGIIAAWPAELQAHVRFFAANSMAIMEAIERQRAKIGVAFVDGNHDYEYASFDIACAARFMQPNGLLIIDNMEQTGPYLAARDFLNRSAGWIEIGDSLAEASGVQLFDSSRRGILGSSFIILRAPANYVIGQTPISTGQMNYADNRIAVVILTSDGPAPKGTLYVQVILRGFFGSSPFPEEIAAKPILHLDGEREVRIELEPTLATQFDSKEHTCEIALCFEPQEPGSVLSLARPPEPSFATA
jgi:predicted O-methyltransferase YrrM